MSVIAQNPIMPGFYPDPSICAVGGDYYLVNSTFAYFPGLPVMHSRDLCHWEQLGNALDRPSQLPLKGAGHSAGLFAPTIRYHKGIFYLICTNVSGGGNFIVTASDPEGPWSEPYYIQGAGGIDPSLFFDEDGKCYYIGTHPNPEGCRYNGDWYIWIQELDIDRMQLVGEAKDVWNGAMRNVIWPEGPHLYKKDGYYYILHAEGGTGPDHAVTVCRSRNIWGPYENNPCNPILTHRHLGKDYPIRYVGHGDIIETPRGEWYMVMLAVRPRKGCTIMGRETFLARVVWENGWPVVNPGAGMLTEQVEIDLPRWDPWQEETSFTCRSGFRNCRPGSSREYDFVREKRERLGDEFLFLRNPEQDMYRLVQGEGLWLKFGAASLKETESPSFAGIRQQHHSFAAKASVDMGSFPQEDDGFKAGLVFMQSNEYHLRMELSRSKAELILCEKGRDQVLGSALIHPDKAADHVCEDAAGEIREGDTETEVRGAEYREAALLLQVRGLAASLSIQGAGGQILAHGSVDISSLSTETAGGFVGCTVGLYAVDEREGCGRGQVLFGDSMGNCVRNAEVCFRCFSYEAMEESDEEQQAFV